MIDQSLRSKTMSGVKWTGINTVGISLFQILQVAVLARFLAKEDFGLVAMTMVVVTFTVVFVEMGLYAAILHCQDATRKESSSVFWLNILNAVFLYFLLVVSAPFVSRFYEEAELQRLIPLLGTNILLLALGGQQRITMQKEFRFRALAQIELSAYFTGFVVSAIAATKGWGAYSLVVGTLTTSLIANVCYFIQNQRVNPLMFYFRLADTKRFLRIGVYNLGNNILDFFSRETDILIIGKLLGSETLGLYSLAKQVVVKIYSMINPLIMTVLNPLLSSVQKETERLKDILLKAIQINASVHIPIYLFIVLLSSEILTILFGQAYSSGFIVLSFLAISYVTQAIGNPAISLQIATGRTDIGFRWTLIRVLVTPLVILIAAGGGINAVAVSLALLSITLLIPHWRMQFKAMANVSLGEYLKRFGRPYAVFAAITSGWLILSVIFSFNTGLVAGLGVKTLVGGLLYVMALWIFDRESILKVKNLLLTRKLSID